MKSKLDSPIDQSAFEAAVERVGAGADRYDVARELVRMLTVEESLNCLDGDEPFWPGLTDMSSGGYFNRTWPAAVVERLGIPGIEFADGPRGCVVRPATAFPVSMARGASFDPVLEERIGEAIGTELRARGATFTGAVCMNLLRHPAWGRAQETYGEDPHHVGEMAVALMTGLQRHVMACMKHFALNSMENARFTVDVTVDERALHEVYLPHFRRVVESGVASVMSAYNSVNGEWCGENTTLLRTILRDEWGFDGFVISDFIFGLRDAVKSVKAGLTIEMPFRQQRAQVLPTAVQEGELDLATVDGLVTEIVATLLRFAPQIAVAPAPEIVSCDAHRDLAYESAVSSMVLLRNDGLLPSSATLRRVAVLGQLAAVANLGDYGSSNVFPDNVSTPLDGLRLALPDVEVVHDEADSSIAEGADLVVVVVGTTRHDEGEFLGGSAVAKLNHLFPDQNHPNLGIGAKPAPRERTSKAPSDDEAGFTLAGGDRRSLRLSATDVALIRSAEAQAPGRVVVCVMGGSAFVMPWIDEVAATLLIWYPGMEGGRAIAEVLLGRREPGGRLPFAIPTDESHLVDFDPDADEVTYGLLHGQWKLDADGRRPHFPFGFGLGFTEFVLTNATPGSDMGSPTVSITASNIGGKSGSTVVQVYASVHGSAWERPQKRLVGFKKVRLGAAATADVTIALDLRQLEIRDQGTWLVEDQPVTLTIGQSAADGAISLSITANT